MLYIFFFWNSFNENLQSIKESTLTKRGNAQFDGENRKHLAGVSHWKCPSLLFEIILYTGTNVCMFDVRV